MAMLKMKICPAIILLFCEVMIPGPQRNTECPVAYDKLRQIPTGLARIIIKTSETESVWIIKTLHVTSELNFSERDSLNIIFIIHRQSFVLTGEARF